MTSFQDNYLDWTGQFVSAPPFDISAFQNQLNRITGLSRGLPILKLEWGCDAKVRKFSKWANGVPIESEDQPKFYFERYHPLILQVIKVPVRRWVITQRTEPEQYGYGDNSDNTFTDEYGSNNLLADKPKDGDYTPYIFVGDHSKCPIDCCKHKLCYGDFKEPNWAELEIITEHTFKLQKEQIKPYQKLGREDYERIALENKNEQERRQVEADILTDLQSKDWWNTHGHRITSDDPSVLKNGKYHFIKR